MAKMNMKKMNELYFDAISIQVTWKCNLKCKYCCTGSPYKQHLPHFPLDILDSSFDKFFSLIEYARKVSFSGGEPLLRKDLPNLIDNFFRFSSRFEFIELITNGTIIPSDELIRVLKKHKERIAIQIDHYGEVSKNADKVAEILENHKLSYRVREYYGENASHGGWVDYGDFDKKHDEKQAHELYRKCFFSHYRRETDPYIDLSNGVVHLCVRSLLTMEKGCVPNEPPEFIDIMDNTKTDDELRDHIFKLTWARYLNSCMFCNGFCADNTQRVLPSVQLDIK